MQRAKNFYNKRISFYLGIILIFSLVFTPFRIQAAENPQEASVNKTTDKTDMDKASANKATTDKATTDETITNEASTDKSPTEEASTDETSTDDTTADKTTTDKASTDKASTDKTSTEKTSTEKAPKKDSTNEASKKKKKKTPKGKWVTKNQKTYYTLDGKKQKGIQKINSKSYFFDSKGVQRTGWQKQGDDYYFFKIANGKKGYMETSTKINGITLKKNGKAKLTKTSLARLDVLIKANKIVERVTKPGMSKSEKLKLCYQYAKQHFQYRGSPTFHKTAHWELTYALDMFDKGHGSCYSYGAALAFLANAVGYQDCYAISSGGHGWTEINGKVYDISWDLVDKNHSYYALSYQLSGIDGRPNYQRARNYVVKI